MRLALDFEPLLPWPLIAALAALLLLTAALSLWRGVRGAWVRALVCLLLIAALFGPVLQREERERLSSVVALVVDESGSQRLDERGAQADAAAAALKERIGALGDFEIREVRAGDSPDGEGTALFSKLADALDDVPPDRVAGAVLVTDGVVHDVPENAAALGFTAPVHALVTGREGEKDRRIVLHRAPRFAILGEPQTLEYEVVDADLDAGAQVDVTLRVNGETVAVDRAGVGERRELEIPIEHAGRMIVELEVEGAAEELTPVNNVAVAEIDVVREHLRVLLVSGEPHAGERT